MKVNGIGENMAVRNRGYRFGDRALPLHRGRELVEIRSVRGDSPADRPWALRPLTQKYGFKRGLSCLEKQTNKNIN